jgi:hypothetical protein
MLVHLKYINLYKDLLLQCKINELAKYLMHFILHQIRSGTDSASCRDVKNEFYQQVYAIN